MALDFLYVDNFFVIVLRGALLEEHFGPKFLQKLVCLSEQLFYFVVLFEFYQFEVSLHISLLKGIETFLCLFILYHFLFLLLQIIDALGLVGQFLSVFVFLAVPFKELFLVDPQVLHKLFVLDLLPSFMIALDLVFQFLHPVAFVPILLELFPSEVVAVEELLLEEAHGVIILFKAL